MGHLEINIKANLTYNTIKCAVKLLEIIIRRIYSQLKIFHVELAAVSNNPWANNTQI
jgi:hypothetical protein